MTSPSRKGGRRSGSQPTRETASEASTTQPSVVHPPAGCAGRLPPASAAGRTSPPLGPSITLAPPPAASRGYGLTITPARAIGNVRSPRDLGDYTRQLAALPGDGRTARLVDDQPCPRDGSRVGLAHRTRVSGVGRVVAGHHRHRDGDLRQIAHRLEG